VSSRLISSLPVRRLVLITTLCFAGKFDASALGKKKKAEAPKEVSAIDQLLAAPIPAAPDPGVYPGSTFSPGLSLIDLASDFRARNPGDLVTIIVLDQASATSGGTTNTQRTTSASSSVSSLFGPRSATGIFNNLAKMSGDQQLKGQGTTSRQTTVSTTVSARVLRTLPNGDLIVEGTKLISINSESQDVRIRGIIRPNDLGPLNTVSSNQVEDMELKINGKGVVADAIRRPNFLYRLLLGVLPF